jgi:hypothetical protein
MSGKPLVFSDKFEIKKSGKNWHIDDKGYLHANATAARSGVLKYPERGFNTYIPLEILKRDGKGLENVAVVRMENHNNDADATNTDENGKGWVKDGSTKITDEQLDCKIVVTGKSLREEILSGSLSALSCRYEVEWIEENGVFEGESYKYRITKITYNHLAVVDHGRAGDISKIHTDRKIMAEKFIQLTLQPVRSGELNLAEQTVSVMSDRAGDERLITNHISKISDRIKVLDTESEKLKNENARLVAENDTTKEQKKQLSDRLEQSVSIDDLSKMAEELVDCRTVCQQSGIVLSDQNKNSPFQLKFEFCQKMIPKSAKSFSDRYKAELEKKEISDQMQAGMEGMYDSAKEQLPPLQDINYVHDALGSNQPQQQFSDQAPQGQGFPLLQQPNQNQIDPYLDPAGMIRRGGN